MTYLERQNAAIDLLQRAHIIGCNNPHEAERLIDAANRLYPVDLETQLILLSLARPGKRAGAQLNRIKLARERKPSNPNKVMAARAAWQRRRVGGIK